MQLSTFIHTAFIHWPALRSTAAHEFTLILIWAFRGILFFWKSWLVNSLWKKDQVRWLSKHEEFWWSSSLLTIIFALPTQRNNILLRKRIIFMCQLCDSWHRTERALYFELAHSETAQLLQLRSNRTRVVTLLSFWTIKALLNVDTGCQKADWNRKTEREKNNNWKLFPLK